MIRPYCPQVHTLILLSLGSLLPLSSYFPIGTHACDIHLIDAHRPYNLENIFGGAVNDGLGVGLRNGHVIDMRNGNGSNGNTGEIQDRPLGRIWIWGDGDEKKLENVKKSWEALEVCRASPYNDIWPIRLPFGDHHYSTNLK